MTPLLLTCCLLVPVIAIADPLQDDAIKEVMKEKSGAMIIIDCASGEITDIEPEASGKRLPPCSTFKIWNALIAIEEGLLTGAGELFYQWDGTERSIAAWNHDLNLRDAFQASCVPAFQDLARRIGLYRMDHWLNALNYGDKNTNAGIDVFWLPAPDRATVLISPKEQAQRICQLVRGELPVKPASIQLLKQLMKTHTTPNGTLYGKTGSGASQDVKSNIGWFVGFIETDGKTFAFATNVQSPRNIRRGSPLAHGSDLPTTRIFVNHNASDIATPRLALRALLSLGICMGAVSRARVRRVCGFMGKSTKGVSQCRKGARGGRALTRNGKFRVFVFRRMRLPP